MRIALKHS